MKCIDTELLQRYIDGEASTDEQTGVEAHLQGCGSCSERLASLQRRSVTIKSLLGPAEGEVVRPPLPSNMDGKLSVEFLAAPSSDMTGSKRLLLKRWGYGVSAACLLAAVFLYKPLVCRSETPQMVLMQHEIVEVDANRPYTEQETVMQVVTSDGSVSYME